MIEKAMREFLRVAAVAVAILAVYFGYVYLSRPGAYGVPIRDTVLLRGLLDDYRAAKGTYPMLPGVDVPIAQLTDTLAASGVTFHSRIRFTNLDKDARYVSNTGQTYGLLYHFSQSGQPVRCLIEVGAHQSGWWKQPPPCP